MSAQIFSCSKLKAARRQIEMAIWLWFKDADIVSVHTLTAAAFGILDGLFHHHGMDRPIPFDDKYRPKEIPKRDWINMFKEAEDFFKRARNDAKRVLRLSPVWTELYLHSAADAYYTLTADKVPNQLIELFVIKITMMYPDLFGPDALGQFVERFDIERLEMLPKTEFFEELGGLFRAEPPPFARPPRDFFLGSWPLG